VLKKEMESVRPGINSPFLDQTPVEESIQKFEVESREVFVLKAEIVKNLDLKPGMKVADIGPNTPTQKMRE
jgi:hypothetical protein